MSTTIINVTINGNIATADPSSRIVCDNKSVYEVEFKFDSMWDDQPVKTARFVYNDHVVDEPITGNRAKVPRVIDAITLYVGVYADDIQTSTSATVECLPSILGRRGTPPPPSDDVYSKIIALIKLMNGKLIIGVDKLPEKDDASDNAIYRLREVIDGEERYSLHVLVGGEWKEIKIDYSDFATREQINKKQDSLVFDGKYDPEDNPVATVQTVVNKILTLIAGSPEDFDTLKEIAEWLTAHGAEARQMQSDIEKNAEGVELANKTADSAKQTAEKISGTANNALEIANTSLEHSLKSQEDIDVLRASKQDNLAFDGEYSAESNKVATVQTVINKLAELIAGAPEDLDTLKELADWLATHGTEAAKMNSDIKTNAENIAKNKADLEAEAARAKAAEEANASAIEDLYANKSGLFIGTAEEYNTAYAKGEIPIGTIVVITEGSVDSGTDSTSSVLGVAILGQMILGKGGI